MKLARFCLMLGAVAGLLAAGDVRAQDNDAAIPIRLNYAVYFGGFNVLEVGIDVELASDSYDVTTRAQTIGVARWLTPWNSVATTEGTFDGPRLKPRRHRQDGEFRGNRRSVSIEFDGADVVALQVHPPPRDDWGRDEVPREAMRGAIDPSSALLSVTRRIAASGSCAGSVQVFDGRRRYDVDVVERGVEVLAPSDYNMFSGDALRCDFTYRPIAGHDLRNADEEMRKRRFRSGRAWFAELLPGQPAVPVRIEVDGDIASTMVHLRGSPTVVSSEP